MNVIEKTRNDIKAYVRSLNTPENTVYQENELLILSCFSKAQEILEENEKLEREESTCVFCGVNPKMKDSIICSKCDLDFK